MRVFLLDHSCSSFPLAVHAAGTLGFFWRLEQRLEGRTFRRYLRRITTVLVMFLSSIDAVLKGAVPEPYVELQHII